MICFISSDRKSAVALRHRLLEGEIFSYHRNFPSVENSHGVRDFLKTLPCAPTVALIDSTADTDFGERACKVLKKEYPEAVRIVFYDRKSFEFERFKFFPTSDLEIDTGLADEPVLSVARVLYERGYSVSRDFCHLQLGKNRHSAFYLGYPIDLSPAEYRILLFLCGHGDDTVTVDNILGHCFAESYRMVDTNVRSHISSINQKAEALGGRKLILAVRGEGYRLNRFM